MSTAEIDILYLLNLKRMKKAENNYVSSMEFTNALNKYIPSLVLQQWMSKIES